MGEGRILKRQGGKSGEDQMKEERTFVNFKMVLQYGYNSIKLCCFIKVIAKFDKINSLKMCSGKPSHYGIREQIQIIFFFVVFFVFFVAVKPFCAPLAY